MLAGSESNVRRLGACDVKAKWVVENRFVTIARAIPENHFVTRPNCLPHIRRLDRRSAHVQYGANRAYDFGSRTGQQ